MNRLGQTRETMLGWDLDGYDAAPRRSAGTRSRSTATTSRRSQAAYDEAVATTGQPTVIIAKTKKGKGVKAVEDQPGKHGKPLDDPEAAIAELGGERDLTVDGRRARAGHPARVRRAGRRAADLGRRARRSRRARRTARRWPRSAAIRGDVVALDGEVCNSTHSDMFREAHADRFFEMYIAEQQMVAAAVGLQVRGWVPFASTFAAFLSRAYDFVRMAAISQADIRLSGSHAGVSIGEDGPSQMALEDIAVVARDPRLDRAVPVRRQPDRAARGGDGRPRGDLVPAHDARQDAGPLRRPARTFTIGGSRVVREGDDVAIVACGITVDQAVAAAEALAGDGIAARVIDAYSVKPIDAETLRAAARECGAIVTVEDHWPEGGLGDAVLEALAEADDRPPVHKLAVRAMPGSGTPDELLHGAGIDADGIADATRTAVRERVG